jgi:hypothetical protein
VYAGERSPRNLFQAFVIMLSMSQAEVVCDEEKRSSRCDVSIGDMPRIDGLHEVDFEIGHSTVSFKARRNKRDLRHHGSHAHGQCSSGSAAK